MSDYYYAETKQVDGKTKIVAIHDSTSVMSYPISGGDNLVPLTLPQYKVLTAAHGIMSEVKKINQELRDLFG